MQKSVFRLCISWHLGINIKITYPEKWFWVLSSVFRITRLDKSVLLLTEELAQDIHHPLPFIKLWQGSSWLIPRPFGSPWSGAFVVTYNPIASFIQRGRGFLHQYFVDRARQARPDKAPARLSPLLLILFVSLFTRLGIICSLLRDNFGYILGRKNSSSRSRCCRISILRRFIMFLSHLPGPCQLWSARSGYWALRRPPARVCCHDLDNASVAK